MDDPFELWWNLYPNHPVARKEGKEKKCRPLFNSFDLETQRAIYADTATRRRTQEWIDGFYKSPHRYLKAAPWVDAVEVKDSVRSTESLIDNNKQKLAHLIKLKQMLLDNGSEVPEGIEEQINRLHTTTH